jgi:GAF domain-containing protein
MRFVTAGIDDAERHRIGALPAGRGALGELIERPVPLRLASVGEHPHSYGFPVGHPRMETFLGVPVFVAGEPFGNLYVTEKPDGNEFTDVDEEALVLLAELAGVAIDHTRRYSGSEARRGELERTVSSLDAMVQISHAIGAQTDLARSLELVAKRSRALVCARTVMIELLADGGLEVEQTADSRPLDSEHPSWTWLRARQGDEFSRPMLADQAGQSRSSRRSTPSSGPSK